LPAILFSLALLGLMGFTVPSVFFHIWYTSHVSQLLEIKGLSDDLEFTSSSSYLCQIFMHHLSAENGLLLLFCCADLRPGGVEETWGRCVVYTRWTNPLLLSRKNLENSVLCLALVAIVSHGAAVSTLQVLCPFASSSLMSDAKPRARSGVFFSPYPTPIHLPAWIFYQWSCEDES
jgi:hypothetical protein